MEKIKNIFIPALLCAALGGCCLGTPFYPPFQESSPRAISAAQDKAAGSGVFVTVEDWPDDHWWLLFKDEQLDALIEEALEANPTMAIAEARVAVANAMRMRATAPLYPSLNFEGDYTRIRNSKNGIFGLAPQFPLNYTQPEASLSFNLEFDIWKKHANLVAASINEIQAREAEAYQARLILAISVAEAYFEMQVGAVRAALADELTRNRIEMIELSKRRRVNGLDNEWTVNRAGIASLTATQYSKQLNQDVTTSIHELQALLAGDFNTQFRPVDMTSAVSDPFPLPATLPMDLLWHRADVYAAQKRVEIAAREIYVAKTNFYPNFNLMGFAGLQTITPSNFFQASSFYGAIGPAVHLPIFEGGALQADYNRSQQEYVIAVSEYNQQVLTAVKEVLNALTIVQKTGEIYAASREAERMSFRNLELAKKRVKNSLSSRIDVLNYESDWLQQRDLCLQNLLECLYARLFLIRSLGGGCEVVQAEL